MLLETRKADVGLQTGIVTQEIARTSRLVSRLTGYAVQPNKAIVGRNAFAHESGIHQDGVLKHRATYEIMDATTIGLDANSLVLGKHSGRHALKQALEELGYTVDGATLNQAFKRFKEVADRKKQVTAMDLEALVTDELRDGARRLDARVVRGRGLQPPPAARQGLPPRRRRRRGRRRLLRRRPGRRDLPRHQHRHGPRRQAARLPDRLGGGGPGRARRGLPSCSSSPASPPRARASPPTSSRRPRSPTSARCRTASATSRGSSPQLKHPDPAPLQPLALRGVMGAARLPGLLVQVGARTSITARARGGRRRPRRRRCRWFARMLPLLRSRSSTRSSLALRVGLGPSSSSARSRATPRTPADRLVRRRSRAWVVARSAWAWRMMRRKSLSLRRVRGAIEDRLLGAGDRDRGRCVRHAVGPRADGADVIPSRGLRSVVVVTWRSPSGYRSQPCSSAAAESERRVPGPKVSTEPSTAPVRARRPAEAVDPVKTRCSARLDALDDVDGSSRLA